MKADERVLQFLVNLSAAIAHIVGTEAERPVSAWAWRLGSRTCQYAVLAVFIALPVALAGIPFGQVWVAAWAGCWAFQAIVVARRFWNEYGRNRRA